MLEVGAVSLEVCVGVRFPNAVEISSIVRCTWPSVVAHAFGYVDVLSWDCRLDLAMLVFT